MSSLGPSRFSGASGTGTGVAVTVDAIPIIFGGPVMVFTAHTVKVYSVPLVNAQMVLVVFVPDPGGTYLSA